jgi:hypothetical protein
MIAAQVPQQPTPVADPTPVALGGPPATCFHPDVEAVVAAIGAEGAGAGVEPAGPAGPLHRRELGVDLFEKGHSLGLLPSPDRSRRTGLRAVSQWLTRQSAADMVSTEAPREL